MRKYILAVTLLILSVGNLRAEWDSITFGAVGYGLTYTFVEVNHVYYVNHPKDNQMVDELVIPFLETVAWSSMQQGYTCWDLGKQYWNPSHWYSPIMGAALAVTVHSFMIHPYINPEKNEIGANVTVHFGN